MNIRLLAALIAVVCMSGSPTLAQQATNPIRYTWIATSCDTWNTAAAALISDGGSGDVLILPTGHDDRPWVILRRVEEGSLFIPDDEPYRCQVHETVALAASDYASIGDCRRPLIVKVPDGRALVVALQDCDKVTRRRATR